MATIVFGAIGAAIGSTIPGVGTSWGWTAGTILGGLLFPPRLPGQGSGPLEDLRLGGSSYNTPIPVVFGEGTVGGIVIWSTDLEPHQSGGGSKGKMAPGGPQYTYTASFAFYLCANEVKRVEKIWFGDMLVYENGESDFDFTIYLGTDDQLPDPTIEAVEGVGNVPGYRGKCYGVVKDAPMGEWGNGIPPVRAKIVESEDIFSEVQRSQSNNVFVRWPDNSMYGAGILLTGSMVQQFAAAQKCASLLHNGGQTALAIDVDGQMYGIGQCVSGESVSIPGTGGSLFGNGIISGSSPTWVSTFGGNDLPNFGTGVRDFAGMTSSIRNAFYVVKADKTLHHFGDGGFLAGGSLRGDGSVVKTLVPTQVHTDVLQVACTRFAVGVIKDDFTVEVTGSQAQQFGLGGTGNFTTWQVTPITDVEQLIGVPNNAGFLARKNDGTVWFSGDNNHNHAGNTTLGFGTLTSWVQVPLPGFITDIAASIRGASALDTDGNVYGWGEAEEAGQGITGTTKANPAVILEGGTSLGNAYGALFALTDDEAYGWGGNSGDELGSGGTLSICDEPTVLPWSAPDLRVSVESIMDKFAELMKLPADLYDFSAGSAIYVQGYIVTSRGEARAQIAPMLEVKNLDLVEFDGKIQLRERGGAVDWNIAAGDLGAHFWEERENPPRPVELESNQEVDLPAVLELAYFTVSRDHEQAVQNAIRYDKENFVDKVTYNVPMVMTDNEAKKAAYVLLWTAWTDANTFSIQVPWKLIGIAPGDILNVPYEETSLRGRVDVIKYSPLGYLKIFCKFDDPENLNHYVSGQPIEGNGQRRRGDVDPGNLYLVAWNGNAVRDEDTERQDIYYAWGEKEETNSLVASPVMLEIRESGLTEWQTLGYVAGYGQVAHSRQPVGFALDALPAPDPETSGLVDIINTVDVICYGGPPESCSIEDMIKQGLNVSILGDEVIAFASVEALGGNSYRLSNLLRGLRGTDWAWGDHTSDDRFAIARYGEFQTIEPFHRTDIALGRMPIGSSFDMRVRYPLLEDAFIPAQVDDIVVAGNELKPYTVVHVTGERDMSNNLTIEWFRRSRIEGFLTPFSEIPLGETTELYEIDIYDGAFVVRTITVTSPTATYSAADQTTDGLTPGDPVEMKLYQIGAIGRGFERHVTI